MSEWIKPQVKEAVPRSGVHLVFIKVLPTALGFLV